MSESESNTRYDVGEEIAQGGMGSVKDARDLHLDRSVALKIIREDREISNDLKQRFVQEARILARLEHPNIIPIHDLDKDGQGRVFYTMKKVQGMDLKQVLDGIRNGDEEVICKHSLNQLLTVFQKVCDAMAYAHSQGVIHRDLKPENVMLGEFGEVWVMDWGLAKVLGEPSQGRDASPQASLESEADSSGFESDSALTMDGQIMGTPQFMAPEQAEGRIADQDARTDVFALGGILYSILTLRAPTSGSSVAEVLDNIKSGYIPPPTIYNKSRKLLPGGLEADAPIELRHCPGGCVPDALSAVTMTAMTLDPDDRYQSVEELQSEIGAFQSGRATEAEEAGGLRLLALAVKRNKTISIAGVLVSILLIAIVVQVASSNRRMKSVLDASAPAFRAEAESLIEAQDLEGALKRIEQAIAFAPGVADYQALKGNIHQTRGELNEAMAAYQQALALQPDHAGAQENRGITEQLLAEAGSSGELTPKQLSILRQALQEQGRTAEQLLLGVTIAEVTQENLDKWHAQLEAVGIKEKITGDAANLELKLSGSEITSLAPLRGIPLKKLNLSDCSAISDLTPLRGMELKLLGLAGTSVESLAPLAGMPLNDLDLHDCRTVKDLAPLANMPLKGIRLNGTAVEDLRPLARSPLETLLLMDCENVSDLTPLKGLRLTSIDLRNCPKIHDLAPLKGMPLEALYMGGDDRGNKVTSLEPLRGANLTVFDAKACPYTDLSPLQGMPLQGVNLTRSKITSLVGLENAPLTGVHAGHTAIRDLSPLKNARLKLLYLSYATNLSDLSPLKGAKIEGEFHVGFTRVSDLEPLRGMGIEILILTGTPVRDLEPLEGMPLNRLNLNGTKVRRLRPLLTCKKLETLTLPLPSQVIDLDMLRDHPSLKQIIYPVSQDPRESTKTLSATEFWKAWDARAKR